MSANIQELDSAGRKRSHSDFIKPEIDDESLCVRSSGDCRLPDDKENDISTISASAFVKIIKPESSETPSITPKVTKPVAGDPVAKRKKPLSVAEKTEKAKADAAKAAEKAAAEEAKKKEREKLEAEKAEKAAEREKKKREKDEADKVKAQQKAAKEAEKKQKAEEREQKRREKEEEEAKKTRGQRTLLNMFNIAAPSTTPQKEKPKASIEKSNKSPLASKKEFTYSQIQPFFLKPSTKLASSPYNVDEETKAAKTKILDEYIEGKRGTVELGPFNPLEALQIPFSLPRGRVYPSVRKIMAEYYGDIDLTTESQNTQILNTREALRAVPVKSLKFREDVRPPYIGTVSGLPPGVQSLRKIARKPISKNVLPLDYDYDSEAEWQEEDGEDVDDLEDEEENSENDEDMDDFLDDSEDAGLSRLVFSGGMVPECTGLCWENSKRYNLPEKMIKYRLEFIDTTLEHHHSIDPWPKAPETPSEASASAAAPGACLPATASKPLTSSRAKTMAPPPVPTDAFKALNPGATSLKKSQKLLAPDMHEGLRVLMQAKPNLRKNGMIQLFYSEHTECTMAQIKASFESMAEKTKSISRWKFKSE
ncbi:chromatin assembly factor 1 subunit A-domain-containing protein [Podospora appendiculata]|uniref:Chromatin assembly factor 1 subunit A-domain-containing protein n=1 Tax=Podospora appendiculata TaxID=314037 RepID=A0AAE1C9W1_9PEZI|nr:chromatin assembly factor 1 subunit A-domain-containing protein [Podospora appendiculata]